LNMNSKKLLVLFLIAIVAIGTGIWVAGHRSSTPTESFTKLYPELDQKLNDATSVSIFTAGEKKSVELVREDNAWRVKERNNYPADESKLRKLLVSIAESEVREEKTSNPQNYASIGVEDLTNESATGVRIQIDGIEPAVSLIIGKQGPAVESRYVRRAGEAQSWLVDTQIDSSSAPKDWLRKSIVDVSADRIQSATITTPGAKPYSAVKASRADANYTVEGIAKGKELSSPTAANGLATALASLTLSDVQTANSLDTKPEAQAIYRTFDGLVIELDGWSKEDKRFVAIRTRYDADLAERFKVPAAEDTKEAPSKPEGSSEAKRAEPQDAKTATQTAAKPNVAEESKTLSEQLSGWVYEIPDYKYDAIFRPLQEMLKE
jgi:hypothetical protein